MAFRSMALLQAVNIFAASGKKRNMYKKSKLVRIAIPSLLVLGLMMIGSIPGYARDKNETIDATAWGTSTQMGRMSTSR